MASPVSLPARSTVVLSQGEFGMAEGPTLDSAAEAQTVTIATPGRVSRTNIVHLGVDHRIADPEADLELRFSGRDHYETPALRCSCVPGGVVTDVKGSVRTAEGRVLLESRQALMQRAAQGLDVDSAAGVIATVEVEHESDQDVVVIYSLASAKKLKNYFHWISEGLTRAALALAAGVPEDALFLMPGEIGDLQAETMALLGIGPERLVVWDGKPTRFRHVYLPSITWLESDGLAASAIELLAALGPPPPEQPPETPRRLFISRLKSPRRLVATEKAIVERAEGLGFEPIFTEEMAMEEKISLMREADMIAGLYGAGLANSIWMPSDATVCEIAPAALENGHELSFWNLAAARGQRYALHIATEAPDPELVEQMLQEAILMRDGEPVPAKKKRKNQTPGERKQEALQRGELEWLGEAPKKGGGKT